MSNDAIQPVDDEISVSSKEWEEWVVNIEAQLDNQFSDIPTESLRASTDNNSEEKPSIFCRFPNLVYFGVRLSPEITAWKFVAFMTRWFGLNVRSFLQHLQEKEDLVCGYYEGLDREYRAKKMKDFQERLLLNSCILIFEIISLQFVRSGTQILQGTKESDTRDQRSIEFNILHKNIMNDSAIRYEMLTMECQIPWFVVEAVYTKHSNLRKLVGIPIDTLAISCFTFLLHPKVNGGTNTLSPGGFKHLLHIFHWSRTPNWDYQVRLIPMQFTPKMDKFYIPSASDLQLSATVFERQYNGIVVSFCERKLSGLMQLPPWYLSEYYTEIYKPLLAFERGYGMVCGFSVTAYVACMVCLLQTEADVRLLRDNRIISSMRDEKDILSSLQWFKTVLSNDIPMSEDLEELLWKVRFHHERSTSRYYGEFRRRYCSNPWITISVVAGILLFVLTFIQTIYSTLSYYKQ